MAQWKGSLELQPDSNYPVFEFTDRVTCQMRWNGTHETCLAWRPARGSVMPGFANLLVDKATVGKGPGGSGVLIVDMSDDSADENPSGKPIEEVVWIEQRIPLQLNPCWADVEGNTTRIDQATWLLLEAWRDTINPALKSDFRYAVIDWNGEILSGTLPTDGGARTYAALIAKGQTTYLDCYPVAMKTTFSRTVSKNKRCPRILSSPLFSNCPDGFYWLRNGHRMTRTGRSGKHVLVQQAIGSVTPWSTLLYTAEET